MSHLTTALWLKDVPHMHVFTFESNGVQFANVKLEIGGRKDYAYLELVFNNTDQIDELMDALSDARVLLEEGEDPCDIQELVL